MRPNIMMNQPRLETHETPQPNQTLPHYTVPAKAGLLRLFHRAVLGAVFLVLSVYTLRAGDRPWNFAVQVSADVDAGAHQITLHWPAPDPLSDDGYVPEHVVYRKAVDELNDGDWGEAHSVGGDNRFVDTVEPGVAYEYKIERRYSHWGAEYSGFGYIRTGIDVPLVEDRGTVVLVVENGLAGALGGSIDQLVSDLAGDGWRVVRVDDFSSGSNPADIRGRIRQEYGREGANVQAVFLLGHLPVVLSGDATNPDGHFIRAMPADGFYGEVNGDWGEPSFDGGHWVYAKNVFPAPVALQVGRVDFHDLPAIHALAPEYSEIELLRAYLAKDHAFRHAQRVPERRALIGDAFGEYYWSGDPGRAEPFSANAYRAFAPLFGDRVTVADNYHGDGSRASNWINQLTDGTYLWAFGCGAGGDAGDSMASLGADGGFVTSVDLVARRAKADFYLFFGSYMVDWARPNNLLRAALAAPDYGLASSWGGRPFLYYHAMGLGETIGYGLRISQNKSGTLYDTPVLVRASGNRYPQGVYIALMGDPTLRLHPVPTVANFSADAGSGRASWSAPGGVDVREYRVYRLNDSNGRYQFEAALPAAETSYTPRQGGNYMVRVVRLENGSGTYLNASQGVFWSTATGAAPEQYVAPAAPADSTPVVTPPSVENDNNDTTGSNGGSSNDGASSGGDGSGAPATPPGAPPPQAQPPTLPPWQQAYGWWFSNEWWWH